MTTAATGRFFLVGFMGAGKTTLGERVARALSMPFVDLDESVERDASMSVADIFAREGEESFRRRESEALRRLLSEVEEAVIALGGGAFAVEANRERVRGAGTSVWLDVPFEELRNRVRGTTRPLWADEEKARALHTYRARSYALADVRLDLGGLSSDEAFQRLRALIAGLRETR